MYDQAARKATLLEMGFEPRTTPWRPDIAAASLEGKIHSKRYDSGRLHQCSVPSTHLRFEPWAESPVESQLLYGEMFVVYKEDHRHNVAWGQSLRDGHVGFVRISDLTRHVHETTYWVSVPYTPVLDRPDRYAPLANDMKLPFNAHVRIEDESDIYGRVGKNMWVFRGDLREIGSWFPNPVDALLPFVGVSPYVSGYRNGEAFDCSGLTQAGWFSMGLDCFRDADQQRHDPRLGKPVSFKPDLSDLEPHDQIYWDKHLAIMVDETRAIHATGWDVRRVVIEPIVDIRNRRLKELGQGIDTVKRR